MTKVFPAYAIVEKGRKYDDKTDRMTDWEKTGGWLQVHDAGAEYIEKNLGDYVDDFFLMSLTRELPWAAVLFTSIIKNSNAVLKARAESRDALKFANYGSSEPGMPNPPVGALVVKRSDALKVASFRHPIFTKSWNALQACSPDENWIAVVDP